MSTATTATSSIANEIQQEVRERKPFSIVAFLKNRWFLYAVSLTAFFALWKYVDYTRVLGNGIAAPEKVVVAIYRLMIDTVAGKSLWGLPSGMAWLRTSHWCLVASPSCRWCST